MVRKTSIRLRPDILDNPKFGMLPDNLWRRTFELYLMAAIEDNDGQLPDVFDIAWRLRVKPNGLTDEIEALKKAGILYEDQDKKTLKIRGYSRFQVDKNSTERVRRYRERRRRNGLNTSPSYDEEAIKRRDGHQCVYCDSSANLCVDHVYPIALGGTDDYRNLVCACNACNSGKQGRTPDQANMKFINGTAEERYQDYLKNIGEFS
jgi:5-methylcytosine-specific restriction endonuclease McrA